MSHAHMCLQMYVYTYSGTNCFDSFPRHDPEEAKRTPALQLCYREFQTWCVALRAQAPRVRWTLSTADCRQPTNKYRNQLSNQEVNKYSNNKHLSK